MISILSSASYLRNEDILSMFETKQTVLLSICENSELGSATTSRRIWELLETPQTVASICRVLKNEFDEDPDASSPGVKAFLADLYREDLIQVSPDS